MAQTPPVSHARQTRTLVFARWVVRNRFPIMIFLISTTLFFLYPIANALLSAVDAKPKRSPNARCGRSTCPGSYESACISAITRES